MKIKPFPGRGIRIEPFAGKYQEQIIALISGIQRGEFHIPITPEQQPDLSDISGFYQKGCGNFWLALEGEKVVGTTALVDIGARQAALRKMFVHEEYRGSEMGVAYLLLTKLRSWAKDHSLKEIFLGTTPFFLAAHRFYEKNGFKEIAKTDLPPSFPLMAVDTKFYQMSLADPVSGLN